MLEVRKTGQPQKRRKADEKRGEKRDIICVFESARALHGS